MNNKLEPELLEFLRQAVAGGAAEFYCALSEAAQQKLLEQIKEQKLMPFAGYLLAEHLPAETAEKSVMLYRKNSIRMLKMQVEFKNLCQLLSGYSIRFAPFKGMDLAYRCYPAPALRYLNDWDILIHPDDCSKALEVLAQDGWTTRETLNLNTLHHHYVQHFKNDVCLEPHRTFAQFGQVAPRDLWEHITPVAPGSFQHVLSAELNLLQLTCHAASWLYSHQKTVKLLLDAAYLLKKEPVDWIKLKKLARQWNLPYPGNLLSAYPEFFAPEVLHSMQGDAEAAAAFRQLAESEFEQTNVDAGEFDLNDERGGLARGVRRGFNRFTARALRRKYHLPERGAYLRLSVLAMWDLMIKFCRLGKYLLMPDKKLKARRKLIKTAEAVKNEK